MNPTAFVPRAAYPEGVPTQPTPLAHLQRPAPVDRSAWSRLGHDLGRDSRLVLPGLVVSIAAVIVLIPLFALSLGTAVIWIGILLLPVTLLIASAFADLSRRRVRQWGADVAEVTRRPRERGLRGWLSTVADGRRWLDLLFESLFALPIRIVTFTVAVSWFFSGLGGLTYFFWGRFLPDDGSGLLNLIIAAWNRGPLIDYGFSAEATFQLAIGFVLLVSFPFVLHGLALLEVAAIRAGLAPTASTPTTSIPSASVPTRSIPTTTSVGSTFVTTHPPATAAPGTVTVPGATDMGR